jgi:hypothetical protein
VAGLPTQGVELYVEGDAHGVATVTGHIAPTAGHEYPLRTARAALEALPRPPRPGNSPEPIEIAGAYLGLEVEDEADTPGPTILVPAWFYTLADGTIAVTAIAVDPAHIGAPPGPSIVVTGGGA